MTRARARRPGLLVLLVVAAFAILLAGAATAAATFASLARVLPEGDPSLPAVILPPPMIHGAAALYGGPLGCIRPGLVRTTVVGTSVSPIVFLRDGRIAKRDKAETLGTQRFALLTRVRLDDYALHTVRVRVTFIEGAIPTSMVLRHRFRQCRSAAVDG